MGACACWRTDYALGHDGHCCFLRDDRDVLGHSEKWRTDMDICHRPSGPVR